MEFTTTKALEVLEINRNTFQDWMDRGFVQPSIQKSSKQGEPNLFSRGDLYRIWFFKYLLETGITRREASEFSKKVDVSFENVGGEKDRLRYLVCIREQLPSIRGGRLISESIKKEPPTIVLGENQIYGVVINLLAIKREVDRLIAG